MTLGLYLHIPFCETKCGYCSFVSMPGDKSMVERYARALADELERWVPEDSLGAPVDSIYFGGGTPSLMPHPKLAEILTVCRRLFDVSSDCEITLEANPGTLAPVNVGAYREMGINRISLGAQSFHDSELAVVGRTHSSSQIADAVMDLRGESIDNINLDLILGLPGQTGRSWLDSLDRAAALGPSHLSVYMLDLSPETPLHALVAAGDVGLPEEDEIACWYLDTINYLSGAGYPQYEISNFSRDGFPCRHNLKYWLRDPVLGFGLGSHSFDGARRYGNTKSLAGYLDLIESGRSPVQWSDPVGDTQGFEETIFLGLRLRAGLDWDTIESRCEPGRLAGCEERLRLMSEEGLIEWGDRSFRLTPRGMLVSNEVFQEFIGL